MEIISEPQSPRSVELLTWSKKPAKKEVLFGALSVTALIVSGVLKWIAGLDVDGVASTIGTCSWLVALISFLALVPSLSFRESSLAQRSIFIVWSVATFIFGVLDLFRVAETLLGWWTSVAFLAISIMSGLAITVLEFIAWRKQAK